MNAGMSGGPDGGNQGDIGALMRASRLGFNFVGTVLACIAIGWFADRDLGTAPWGVLSMTLIGFFGGFWILWRALAAKDRG